MIMATPLNLLDLLKSGVVSANDPVKELAHDTAKAQQKIQLVMRWLESNAAHGARAMVNKFNLAWSHEKTLAGGVALVGFYTDESMRFEVCRLHLKSSDWFRN